MVILQYMNLSNPRMIVYHRPVISTYMVFYLLFVIIKGFIIIKSFLFIVPFLPQLETSHEIISLGGCYQHDLIKFFGDFFEFPILTYTDMDDIVGTSKIFLIIISIIRKLILMVKKALFARGKIIKQ